MNATDSTTLHLGVETARALLQARGWILEPTDSQHYSHPAYVRPGGRLRAEGGKCGPDYLWALDEALTVALQAEAATVTQPCAPTRGRVLALDGTAVTMLAEVGEQHRRIAADEGEHETAAACQRLAELGGYEYVEDKSRGPNADGSGAWSL